MDFISLTDEDRATIAGAFSDLFDLHAKACRLVYPPRLSPCPNCIIDTMSGRSSGRYRPGGPRSFQQGTCPVCLGVGRLESAESDDVRFVLAWRPKEFFLPIPDIAIRAPQGAIQTKGRLSDLPRTLRADYLVADVGLEGVFRKKFRLLEQPVDHHNLVPQKYFVATWIQVA
jgi:hypothetical protein